MLIDPGLLAKLGLLPDSSTPTFAVGLTEFKKIVSRDLEHLLNTKRHLSAQTLQAFRQAERSLAAFGVDDFSARYFENVLDVSEICRAITQSIQTFEPRLQQVHVHADQVIKSVGGLGLSIAGLLVAPGVREPIRFNAVFDIITKKYAISAHG
jgi:type VI secretion system lysozyme-like protein